MIRSLWTAATGMEAQQLNIDTISNNLANVNTTGFKKSRVNFQDLIYQVLRRGGTPTALGSEVPTGIEVGHGVRPVATQKIFSQGSIQSTDNPLDLVIEGDGFFQVLQPDGNIAYTRDGSFKVDRNGRVCTSDGLPVIPELHIPQDTTSISISGDGIVSVQLAGGSDLIEIGHVELARFINPSGLTSIGRNLFQPTSASGEPIVGYPGLEGFGTIGQGYLEMSNVKVVEEMVDMITAQRAYEVNSKSVQAADEVLRLAAQLRR